ncbi:MAG: carotenoid biosynthesis protein [Bernardetiaceae bacterium]|nr:carotenoid biosynthesis protein [Bernardetiaceae bacterium]
MFSDKKLFRFAVGLLYAMYFFGFWGMKWELTRPYFEMLTPLNLLFGAFFLYYFSVQKNQAFYYFMITAGCIGFFAEWIGVHTGLLFGDYSYGATLGLKLWDIPLMIAVNWWMLAYACICIVAQLGYGLIVRVLIAATLMTCMDFLIEPVAIQHDMWTWQGDTIPLSNFIGWYVVSAVIFLIGEYLPFKKQSRFAPYLLIGQVLFFVAHNLSYWI